MINNYLEIISLNNSKMASYVKPKGTFKKAGYNQQVLYSQILITKNISISINNIGNSIKATLEKAIAFQIEGKCIVEGYIKPKTVEIITFSSGLVSGSNVMFVVVFQCYVCSPVEGMLIQCIAKHINKAGIRAEINETPSPVVIFIARDHNYASPLFAEVKENDEIKVKVIGQRFELNDKYISIIAEIVELDAASEKSPHIERAAVPFFDENIQDIMPEQEQTLIATQSIAPRAIASQAIAPTAEPTAEPTASGIAPVTKKKATIRIKKAKITVEN